MKLPLAKLLRSARALLQCNFHQVPLLVQARYDERINCYLCALLTHGFQFLGGMRSLHGQ